MASDAADSSTPLAYLGHSFATHTPMLTELVTDFTDEDWMKRPGDTSSAYWLLGHLTYCRMVMLVLAGEMDQADLEAWRPIFGKGSKPTGTAPIRMAELMEAFEDLGGQLVEVFKRLESDRLDEEAFREFPGGSKTNGQALAFLAFHDGYHVGQIGLIARLLGRRGLGR